MRSLFLCAGFGVAGAIHLLPLYGVLGAQQLLDLYGVPLTSSKKERNVLIMMRHRAVLFGILGFYLLYAIGDENHQNTALIGGFSSTISFFSIAMQEGGYNRQLQNVLVADLMAIGALIVAAGSKFML